MVNAPTLSLVVLGSPEHEVGLVDVADRRWVSRDRQGQTVLALGANAVLKRK